MEEIKYYDVVTKQEISKEEIKANTPYIALIGKWKIRMVTHMADGKVEEKLLTLQEEQEAKKEILRQRLMQRGYKVGSISNRDYLVVNDIKINVPNYAVEVANENGQRVEAFFDTRSIENMVETTEKGKTVSISNLSFGENQSLLETPMDSSNRTRKATNVAETEQSQSNAGFKPHNITINIDQWGYKRSYDLRKPGEMQRLMEDQKTMPRTREEAMSYGENNGLNK